MDKKPLIIIVLVLIALSVLAFFVVVISKKTTSPNIVTNIIAEVKNSQLQGLKIEVLTEGMGSETQKGDRVVVKYVGTFKDGTQFASSDDSRSPSRLYWAKKMS